MTDNSDKEQSIEGDRLNLTKEVDSLNLTKEVDSLKLTKEVLGLKNENDRELFKSWPDMWRFAFKRKLGCDVIFKVGPEEVEIWSHKIILMVHSEAFEAMFDRWKEGELEKENNISVVKLVDDNAESFKFLLKFLCTYEVGSHHAKDSEDFSYSAFQLLKMVALARKYLMPFPAHHAKMLLTSRNKLVNTTNVIELYHMAKSLLEDELKNYFETEIISRAFVIFKTEAVLQFTLEDLIHFVKMSDLNSNEIQIFNGCIRWAEHQCDNRELARTGENFKLVLGDVTKFIRFPVLSQEKLLLDVKSKNILSDKELIDIVCYKKLLRSNSRPEEEIVASFPYITEPRDRVIILQRFERKYGDSVTLDCHVDSCISFDVDRDIKLCGLGFFGGPNDCTFTINVKVKFWHAGQVSINDVAFIKTKKIDFKTKSSIIAKNVFPVYFEKPVDIKKSTCYYITFSIEGSETYYSRKLEYNISQQTHRGKVTFKFHNAKNNQSSFHFGQMPYMYFRFPGDADVEETESKTKTKQKERN